jgi:hypothetical protein
LQADQRVLTGVSRASVYRQTVEREQGEEDLLLCQLWTQRQCFSPNNTSHKVCFDSLTHSLIAENRFGRSRP